MHRVLRRVAKIQVTIQVSVDVACILQGRGEPTTESNELLKTAEELGVVLEPLHPGTDDLLLVKYFIVEVPDHTTAEHVISHLRRTTAVESAYLKPPDELP